MKASPAKKEFKNRFGQANHFLITALVGIDGIQTGIITEKPESFNTSWNPRDTKRSADRTRVFILKSFLGWAVESLEMYLTELNRKPKLLESETFTSLFSKAGQSVYKKTILIADEIKVDEILITLMEVLITWRNYTFHYDIDNEIRESSMQCLIDKSEEVKTRFSGLDIIQLKKTWENGGDFTFKETASLIKATQDFVSAIDSYVLSNLDYERFLIEITQKHFSESEMSLKRYYSFDKEKKEKYLKVLLQNIAGESELNDNILKSIMKELEKK
ncbi:MAG: hypothetical protein CVU08_04775 [Bacteroidetes bacterium HGW-Bacteroidetes-3]|jgi:hypothetical protein|nr:MAG: hypothetical protein CVU08_04775 [Bacteroidetes bacterium HGW-Bacteroidetes-3]